MSFGQVHITHVQTKMCTLLMFVAVLQKKDRTLLWNKCAADFDQDVPHGEER
jgi:hypothetical protein